MESMLAAATVGAATEAARPAAVEALVEAREAAWERKGGRSAEACAGGGPAACCAWRGSRPKGGCEKSSLGTVGKKPAGRQWYVAWRLVTYFVEQRLSIGRSQSLLTDATA
jgi:hypothetical protein